MSKAKDLSLALSARLATITTANGYATDIGARVLRGATSFPESYVPCVVLSEGDDDPAEERAIGGVTHVRNVIKFSIEGTAPCDPDNPNDTVHDIIADLKKAIFSGDLTYGGLIRPSRGTPGISYRGRTFGERADGASFVGGGILIDCEIHEELSNP